MTQTDPRQMLLFFTPGTCALSAQVALEWLGEPYRLCRVDRAMRSSETYKRVNPHGKVPAMRIGTRVLTEANAILAHIAARGGPQRRFLPSEGFDRDLANQWLAYLASGFHAAFFPYFAPSRFIDDEAKYQAVKQKAIEQARKQFEYVEHSLANGPWVLGETRTLLDPYLYAMSRWGRKFSDVRKDFPRISDHQARLEQDPAVVFALAVENGEAAKSPSGALIGMVDLQSA